MRRAVSTGIGVIAPGEPGRAAFWDLVTSGQTATRRISAFDAAGHRCTVAAECTFDPVTSGLSLRLARRTDRLTQLALVAAREAIADSGIEIDGALAEETAVSLGSAVGGTTSMESEYAVMSDGGSQWLVDASYAPPHLYNRFLPSSLAAEVALDVGALGPAAIVSTGCTSGIDAVGHALELIRGAEADVVITGASDAPISPITLTCFDVIKATSPYNDDPAAACRPFDRTRAGLVLGEGVAVMVLE